jgi:hypothetical protein
MVMIGACRPLMAMTTNPRVAARLYAGAVDATPTTTEEISPSAPPLRPFSPMLSGLCGGAARSVIDDPFGRWVARTIPN